MLSSLGLAVLQTHDPKMDEDNPNYYPFPDTDKKPYKSYYHHFPSSSSSLSSSSSAFQVCDNLPPCPSPYLSTDPMPISPHPPPYGSSPDPSFVRPSVQYPVPYTGQAQPPQPSASLSFSGVPLSRPNYINFGVSNGLPVSDQERRAAADALITKVARTKRRIARQKTLGLDTGMSSATLSAMLPYYYYDGVDAITGTVLSMQSGENHGCIQPPMDPYNFITHDNKRLKLILTKELKNSDVNSLGRIVLPKREAEQNLPSLTTKEGIQLVIKDLNSEREWSVKYKYWTNNKSRMYLLENTGDFVKQNGLEIEDTLILYEDKSLQLYFSIKKAEKPLHEILQRLPQDNHCHWNSFHVFQNTQPHDEEEAALALLIEQLGHRDQQEVTLPLLDYTSSSSSQHMAPTSEPQTHNYFTEHNSSSNNYKSFRSPDGTNSCTFPFLDQWSGGSEENH